MSVDENVLKTFQGWEPTISRCLECQSELMKCVREERGDEEEFLTEFWDLESDVAKLSFLHEHLGRFGLLEDKYIKGEKDDKKADRHRRKGDNAFIRNENVKAIDHYSRSLMTAKSEEILAKSYANRSAALYRLEMYEESMEDIDRAVAHSYPANQLEPLTRRRKTASELARTRTRKSFYQDPPHLAQNQRHPTIPYASRNIEVRWLKNRRAVYAAKNIRIGDVIAIEEPVAHIITTADIVHCHHCHELCYNPIPCKFCCQVVYCNETCRDEARQKYHLYECGLLASIQILCGRFSPFIILAMKMTILKEKGEMRNEFMLDGMMMRISKDDLFSATLIAAVYFDLVKSHTRTFENETQENTFRFLFMKFALRCFVGIGGIDELAPSMRPDLGKWCLVRPGGGIFPFFTSFRHACNPNVMCHHYGTRKVLRARRSIKEGEECFVSYGPLYVDKPIEERRDDVFASFYFVCKCRACEENWVLERNEAGSAFLRSQRYREIWRRLRQGDIEFARSIPTFLAEKVREFEHLEPNWSLCCATKGLSFCYDMLANKRDL